MPQVNVYQRTTSPAGSDDNQQNIRIENYSKESAEEKSPAHFSDTGLPKQRSFHSPTASHKVFGSVEKIPSFREDAYSVQEWVAPSYRPSNQNKSNPDHVKLSKLGVSLTSNSEGRNAHPEFEHALIRRSAGDNDDILSMRTQSNVGLNSHRSGATHRSGVTNELIEEGHPPQKLPEEGIQQRSSDLEPGLSLDPYYYQTPSPNPQQQLREGVSNNNTPEQQQSTREPVQIGAQSKYQSYQSRYQPQAKAITPFSRSQASPNQSQANNVTPDTKTVGTQPSTGDLTRKFSSPRKLPERTSYEDYREPMMKLDFESSEQKKESESGLIQGDQRQFQPEDDQFQERIEDEFTMADINPITEHCQDNLEKPVQQDENPLKSINSEEKTSKLGEFPSHLKKETQRNLLKSSAPKQDEIDRTDQEPAADFPDAQDSSKGSKEETELPRRKEKVLKSSNTKYNENETLPQQNKNIQSPEYRIPDKQEPGAFSDAVKYSNYALKDSGRPPRSQTDSGIDSMQDRPGKVVEAKTTAVGSPQNQLLLPLSLSSDQRSGKAFLAASNDFVRNAYTPKVIENLYCLFKLIYYSNSIEMNHLW